MLMATLPLPILAVFVLTACFAICSPSLYQTVFAELLGNPVGTKHQRQTDN